MSGPTTNTLQPSQGTTDVDQVDQWVVPNSWSQHTCPSPSATELSLCLQAVPHRNEQDEVIRPKEVVDYFGATKCIGSANAHPVTVGSLGMRSTY